MGSPIVGSSPSFQSYTYEDKANVTLMLLLVVLVVLWCGEGVKASDDNSGDSDDSSDSDDSADCFFQLWTRCSEDKSLPWWGRITPSIMWPAATSMYPTL